MQDEKAIKSVGRLCNSRYEIYQDKTRLRLSIVGVVIVAFIANQITASEFQQFMFQGQMVRAQDLANELAADYRARRNWEGVGARLNNNAG